MCLSVCPGQFKHRPLSVQSGDLLNGDRDMSMGQDYEDEVIHNDANIHIPIQAQEDIQEEVGEMFSSFH